MIDLYFLSVLIFFSIIAILIIKDRKNMDFKYFLIMRRTKKFRNTIDKIANKSVFFWKIVGTVAVIVCLGAMIFGTYMFLNVTYLIITGVIKQPAAQLVIPIPLEQTAVGPGFIGIPFWFWIIIIGAILIPHEAFHGIIARAEKIKLRDVGLMLLLLQFISIPIVIIYFIYTGTFDFMLFLIALLMSFPGAFVEPEEKQLNKSKLMTKLRIFSAGSFINIFIGLLLILLVQNLLWYPNVNGVLITGVNETSPAGQIGLKPGMILESINGKEINIDFYRYSSMLLTIPKSNTENITYVIAAQSLFENLADYKPGDVVKLNVNGINYDLKLGEHPSYKDFPYIGITSKAYTKNISLFSVVFPLFGLMSLLSILVGTFNILPIYPLDGGLIVKGITEKYFKKKTANRITMAITYILFIAIVYAFVRGLIPF